MMLRWWGNRDDDPRLAVVADRIEDAVAATLASGLATADLGGSASTSQVGEGIVQAITKSAGSGS